jgi:hypothetical protein
MKLYFQWKYSNLKKIQKFNSDHETELSAITDYAAEETKLDAIVTNIGTADEVMATDLSGITEDVKDVKKEMALCVIQFAHKGRPLARNAGNMEMVKLLKHEISYILYASKTNALSRARNIKDTLKNNVTIFTNITPANIALMEVKIKAYDEVQSNTKVAIEHKKITGTRVVEEEFEKSLDVVDNMYDLVVGEFAESNPALVEELGDLIELDKTGAKHTGIIAVCIDNNPPSGSPSNKLEGVQVKIVERGQIGLSDIMGLCGIVKVWPGTYHVEFSKAGFVAQTLIITFKRGVMLEQEVKMVRV